jgi:hypothetical protein
MAAIEARRALAAATGPLAGASPATRQALAYAPPSASQSDRPAGDRANAAAASAGAAHLRPTAVAHDSTAAPTIDPLAAKSQQGQGRIVATKTRLAANANDNSWIRVMMLAPSASSSLSVTVLGDTDMPHMRSFFVKPATVISTGFSDDPQFGMLSDRFAGSATALLSTRSFATRTASLR